MGDSEVQQPRVVGDYEAKTRTLRKGILIFLKALGALSFMFPFTRQGRSMQEGLQVFSFPWLEKSKRGHLR